MPWRNWSAWGSPPATRSTRSQARGSRRPAGRKPCGVASAQIPPLLPLPSQLYRSPTAPLPVLPGPARQISGMLASSSSLLTLGPTARRLRVPVKWLRAEADARRVPCLKAGSVYLFDLDAVEKVLLERARKGDPDHAA